MAKLGFNEGEEWFIGITSGRLLYSWLDHVDNRSCINDDSIDTSGHTALQSNTILEAFYQLWLFPGKTQFPEIRQRRWTTLVFMFKELVEIAVSGLTRYVQSCKQCTITLKGGNLFWRLGLFGSRCAEEMMFPINWTV
jgi:hypothetical protein